MKTLIETIDLIKKINESEDYSSYISNGKVVIESKIITIGGYNGKF